jgi:catechol 2,3-dioxygenase-like lactoylglutathione lyase family enzyme
VPIVDDELTPVAPEFFVPNIDAAVAFYVEKLGFRIVRHDPGFAVVALGEAIVMFAHQALYGRWLEDVPLGLAVDIRIMVEDVDAMHRRCLDNGIEIVYDIGDREYGLRDFIVSDLNGFRLRFASALA